MDRNISLTLGKRNIHISLLSVIGFLYISRSSILTFARQFSLTTIFGGIILVGFLLALFVFSFSDYRNICIDGILLVLIIAAFFFFTLLAHPEYSYRYEDPLHDGRYSATAIFKYGAGIYFYYIIRLFRNEEQKLFKLYKVIAFSILLFDTWALMNRTAEYSMTFGYQMEMAAIIFIMLFLRERKKRYYLFLSIITIALGVLYGSRGCIIGYVVFIVLYFIWDGHINFKKILLMILGVIAALIYSSETLMMLIYRFFNSLGFHSRTLYFIAAGDVLAVDQARQKYIWPELFEELKNMPLFKVYGAYGDRYLLSNRWVYAHNFVFEILLTFGFIIGGAILLWMLVQFIIVIRKNKDVDGLLAIVFGSFALCRLFFSSSFWMEPYFWAFIAMLINCAAKRRKQKKLSKMLLLQGDAGEIAETESAEEASDESEEADNDEDESDEDESEIDESEESDDEDETDEDADEDASEEPDNDDDSEDPEDSDGSGDIDES